MSCGYGHLFDNARVRSCCALTSLNLSHNKLQALPARPLNDTPFPS